MKKLITALTLFASMTSFAQISCSNLKEYTDYNGKTRSPNAYVYMGITNDNILFESGSRYDEGFSLNKQTIISYSIDRGSCFLWQCYQDKEVIGYEVAVSTIISDEELKVEEFYLDSKKLSKKELAKKAMSSDATRETSIYDDCTGLF